LRLLKIVQRKRTKSRTQAANQLRTIVATAPDELRTRLRALKTAELVETCAAFRVRVDDDTWPRHQAGYAGTRPAHPTAR
jgi:glutamyl-tRNA reductase